MLIYKTLLGFTPPYLRYLLQPSSSTYNTRSTSHILLKVPKAHTSLGCSTYQFALAIDWNELQKHSNWTVLSTSRLSKTQSWTLLQPVVAASRIVVSTFLPFALLSVPNNVCTMFSAATMLCCYYTMLLLCCVATMLCCHVLLPCYVVLLHLHLIYI